MPRFYIWLVALITLAMGCGGHSDDGSDEEDSGTVDANRDRDSLTDVAVRDRDTASNDATADTRDVSLADNGGDRRADAQPDARDAGSTTDARADSVDAGADRSVDSMDARADALEDSRDGKGDGIDAADASRPPDAHDATYEPPVVDGFDDVQIADAEGDAADGCTPVTCTLLSLTVTPAAPSISPHSTRRMNAIGAFSDGTTLDVTKNVVWSRSNTTVHVSNAAGNEGLVTARYTGTSVVSAQVGALSGSATVNVMTADPAILRLTPSVASIASGTQQPLKATVIFSDMSSWSDWTSMTQWSSSAPSVATVADGIVTGVAPGTTTITATVAWLTASAQVIVTPASLSSLSIDPPTETLPLGLVRPFRAKGHFSDGTTQDLTQQAVWGSSSGAIATVGDMLGSKGKVSCVGTGNATISASFGGMGASSAIVVSAANLVSLAVLNPPSSRLMVFIAMPMAAMGTYSDGRSFDVTDQTTWSSSDSSIIEVSGNVITGIEEGFANIDAHVGSITQSLLLEVRAGELENIAIQPNPGSIVRGSSVAFYATGTYTGGSTYDLTWFLPWNTVDPSVAFIVDPGVGSPPRLTGVTAGSTSVTASWAGIGASSVVDVTTMNAPSGP
jgi:hypothetical protein